MYCFAIVVFMIFPCMDAFNFSPYPSKVINSPTYLKFQFNQTRSSYFGYSLVIRPSSIFVGAPRAQTTLVSQQNIEETGSIYRCSLDRDHCSPYIVDSRGNVGPPGNFSERKDFQWLGGSMAGGTLDTDMLLVCAPRFQRPTSEYNHMMGVCYLVQNTVAEKPGHVTILFRIKNNNTSEFNYVMSGMGLSAHVVEDNTKLLIGAPGHGMGLGSVLVYRQEKSVLHFSKWDYRWKRTDPDKIYFGYATSSGHFDSANILSLLYVVTAPQKQEPSGVAYILDSQWNILLTLRGEQLGDYFGYSVLVEDLNGDKLVDLIVSAPMYGTEDYHDNGAIYVFINKGLLHFEQRILRSPVAGSARFGTTLSRLGDINHDGFNDVAVGAPFAGNGSVFIYLGSEHGLRDVPSQQLESPSQHPSKYGAHMFGHGLSRGSDIDGNGFNDLAVGAPNAEAVFLYRTYPVVKIYGTIRADRREIRSQQEALNITACYRLSTTSKEKEVQHQVLAIRIVAGPQINRATFALTQTNEMNYRADVGLSEQCRVLELQVSFTQADVYKPIDVTMHYEVIHKEADPTTSTDRIVFNTGCTSAVCMADLQLESPDTGSTFTLGSNSILRLTYHITNSGETAYLPQFNVTSGALLTFAQVPGNCQVSKAVMMCDLNGRQALAKGESDSVTVSFDVSQLSGRSLTVTAEVFSAGNDKNLRDNKHVNVISLREFTDIDVTGEQTNPQVNLESYGKSAEIQNHYKIKSHGPSAIDQLRVVFQIPFAYRAVGSMPLLPIINITSLRALATYDSQPLTVDLTDQDNNQLSEKKEIPSIGQKEMDLGVPTNNSYDLGGNLKGKLPLNRTFVLSCQDSEKTMCIRASVPRIRLRPGETVYLNVSYHVNLGEVNAILRNPLQYFVILTDVTLIKKDDPTSSSFDMKKKMEPIVISKHLQAIISLWAILPSVVVGLLILAVINYAMFRVGFFRRAKKEEMKRARQQRSSEKDIDLGNEIE